MKQNLDLTRAECRANAVNRFREILNNLGVRAIPVSDYVLWDMFRQMEAARDNAAAEGGYFQGEI